MRLPLAVGRAGLNLTMFIVVLAAMILFFGRPTPGSAAFVITVIMIVGATVTTAVLMIAMRRTKRAHDSRGRNHHD